MKRQVLALAVTIVLILANVGLAAGTGAQGDNNDIDDLQATAEAQQTEIADLGDDIDDLQATSETHEETIEAQETEIAGLEERVAAVETAVAVEEVPQATPVSEEPVRGAGDVLYEADETGGFDEWTGPAQWLHRDGNLLNDGTETRSLILAPYQPTVSDYAVEAEIRLVRCSDEDEGTFGVVARAVEEGAYYYRAGHYCYPFIPYHEVHIWAVDSEADDVDTLVQEDFTVDAEWHTYRLEVQGDAIRLFIDGELLLETGDVRYADAGQAGLWSSDVPIEVRSFRVLAL